MRSVVLAIAVAFAASACKTGMPTPDCPDDEPDSCPTSGAPSYANDVAPIISQYCEVTGCHVAGGSGVGLLSPYSALSADANNAENQIDQCLMPKDPPYLSVQERLTLLTWFVCGAPNN
jgi:hypothetical protein